MTSIAIIGAGAIGGTVAAWLTEAGNEVTLCVRTPVDRLTVETPSRRLTPALTVLTDPAKARPADWVILATKAYDVPGAVPWLERLTGPATRVAVLQNGVEHIDRVRPFVPEDRIVPAVVDIPASRSAPGRVVQHRDGWIVVPEGADGDAFVRLFGAAPIAVSAVPDWTSRAWGKLCLNCAGAVSALTLGATGPGWSDEMEALVRGLARECAAVGRAEGAVIEDSLVEAVVAGARASKPGALNSMAADRLAGRPMELETRNGVIVRLGRKHGIRTPLNALMMTLLGAAASPWADRQG